MISESLTPRPRKHRAGAHQPAAMRRGGRARIFGSWLLAIVVGTYLLVVPLPFGGQVAVKVGQVAPSDVTASRQITYISPILTHQREDLAASAVPDVYDSPQASIGRQQLAQATRLLDLIATTRNDTTRSLETRSAELRTNAILPLSSDLTGKVLGMPGPEWDRVASEVQAVLDRAMHGDIRASTLPDERRKVPGLVALDLSDADVAVVSLIVQGLLVPNSFYNAQETEARRKAASDQVDPVTTTIAGNERILRAGDVVTPLDMEALQALGLEQDTWSWQNTLAAAAVILLFGTLLLYYLWTQEPGFWADRYQPFLLALMSLVFLLAARALISPRTPQPYLFPSAALAMVLTVLTNQRVALVTSALLVLLVGWLSGSVALVAYGFCGALVSTMKLRHGERIASYASAALYVAASNVIVVAAFTLASGPVDPRVLLELEAAALANGLITMMVALLITYVAGAVFGLTTPLQLVEISRPTQPLLRHLLLRAPGTYHHTLIVSNMAERAAEAIGADAQLARVGAYYHDIGKASRPYFFIENRSEGSDPHARLDPYTSAQIIISHVKDGLDLARKYRLPRRITDFISEHHGTMPVVYFLHEAVKQAGSADKVDRSQFLYPGPKPQSRETAITMLADGAEATVRSRSPSSVEELNQIIAQSIQVRLTNGQLDDCSLTFIELQVVQQAFADVLRGLHHPRIVYPEEPRPSTPQEPTDAETEMANASRPEPEPAAPRPAGG